MCVQAESETVGAPTGGLDQTVAVFALPLHALLIDFADDSREQVPFDPASQGLAVLVIDTRVSHELTDGGYGARRDDSWEAAKLLGSGAPRAQATSDQVRRCRYTCCHVPGTWSPRWSGSTRSCGPSEEGRWDALGPLLDASHESLREDYEVSCEELDLAVETARQAGALGARMTGGGFGGSAIALVPLERVDAVRAAVTTAFVAQGWRRPDFLVAEPGPGARVR